MNLVRIAISAAALALAVFVGLSSYAVVNQLRAPQRAYAVGVVPQSAARANLAFVSFFSRKAKDNKAKVSAYELGLARSGYRTSPLALSALSVVALATDDEKARFRLLDATSKLSRRQASINAQLIEAAAKQGNERAFFTWLSRAALTDVRQRDTYVQSMAVATSRPDSIAALTPVLGRNPDWADFYWQNVAVLRDSVVNAAKLRMATAAAPWNQRIVTDNDQTLVLSLVRVREFDVAKQLSQRLAPLPATAGQANLLQNANFTHQPQMPPFDWQLGASGNLGSTIVEHEKALLVSAIGGAQGVAARQLVALTPGSYDIGWSLGGADVPQTGLLLQLTCAEKGKQGPDIPEFPLTGGKHRQRVSLASDCKWYWFTISASLDDNAPGIDAYVRDLSLMRAGPATIASDKPE